jgi:hypothetical protein
LGLVQKWFYQDYDLDATTYKYGKLSDWRQGWGGFSTSGSSTTVTAATAGIGTFAPLAVGDKVRFLIASGWVERVVTAVASPDSITVSSAIDASGGFSAWNYRSRSIGTAITSGLHSLAGLVDVTLYVNWVTKAADSIVLSIETVNQGDQLAHRLYDEITLSAAGVVLPFDIEDAVHQLRVGVKAGSSAAGTDVFNAYLEGKEHF